MGLSIQSYLEALGLAVLSIGIIVLGHAIAEPFLVSTGEATLPISIGYLIGANRANSISNGNGKNGNGNSH